VTGWNDDGYRPSPYPPAPPHPVRRLRPKQQLGLAIGKAVAGSLFGRAGNLVADAASVVIAEQLLKHDASRPLSADEYAHQAILRRWWQFWEQVRESITFGTVGVIGAKGTGKTAACLAVAELLGKPVYALGLDQAAIRSLQRNGWGQPPIAELELRDVPEFARQARDCTILVDDAALYFSRLSYNRREAQVMEQLWAIQRHKSVVFIINGQTTAGINKHLMQPDLYLLKPPSMMFRDNERTDMLRKMDEAEQVFAPLAPEARKSFVYAICEWYRGLVGIEKPSGWTDAVSMNKASTTISVPGGTRPPVPATDDDDLDDIIDLEPEAAAPVRRYHAGGRKLLARRSPR